jgi:hypothetical protein
MNRKYERKMIIQSVLGYFGTQCYKKGSPSHILSIQFFPVIPTHQLPPSLTHSLTPL